MKYIQWVTYKGKDILSVSVSYRTEAEYINALKEYQAAWMEKPDCPTIMDLTGALSNSAIIQAAERIHQENIKFREEHKLPSQPMAIVGGKAIVNITEQFTNHHPNIYFASDLESAKNWLYENS